MKAGRAILEAISGKDSIPCDNCGTSHATMYTLSLSKIPGQEKHIQWVLCVDCKLHIRLVFESDSSVGDGY